MWGGEAQPNTRYVSPSSLHFTYYLFDRSRLQQYIKNAYYKNTVRNLTVHVCKTFVSLQVRYVNVPIRETDDSETIVSCLAAYGRKLCAFNRAVNYSSDTIRREYCYRLNIRYLKCNTVWGDRVPIRETDDSETVISCLSAYGRKLCTFYTPVNDSSDTMRTEHFNVKYLKCNIVWGDRLP